jgi:hypothetical protein
VELMQNGWQVTVQGPVVRLDDLPLAAWERVTETTGQQWVDCYYKPLADLTTARLLLAEACQHAGIDAAKVLDNVTVPALLAMFEQADDDLPVEVADGIPQEGDGSTTAG